MRLPDGRMVLQLNPAETSLQYRAIIGDRTYLRGGIRLHPGDTVFDVGANIGIASIFFADQCSDLRIFAFEPTHPLFEALCHNLAEHKVNGKAFDCALSDRNGSATVGFYPHTTAMSSIYADSEYDSEITRTFLRNSGFSPADIDDMMVGRHALDPQSCELRTISDVIRTEQVERIDLLKINVEKAECDVLAGIAESDWPLVRQITMQVHDIDGRAARVPADLTARGFETTTSQEPLLAGTDIHDLWAWRP